MQAFNIIVGDCTPVVACSNSVMGSYYFWNSYYNVVTKLFAGRAFSAAAPQPSRQGCGLGLDFSVSRRSNVSSRCHLDRNCQCLGLISVSAILRLMQKTHFRPNCAGKTLWVFIKFYGSVSYAEGFTWLEFSDDPDPYPRTESEFRIWIQIRKIFRG